MHRGRGFCLILLFTVPGCASSKPPPPTPPPATSAAHEQGHEHGHTLVHRFEHADEWAPRFDDPARDAWQKPQDVIAAMEIKAGMRVADIGAGTGYFEPHLSRAVTPSGAVLALDVEPDMVRYLKERAAREKLTNVQADLASPDGPGAAAKDLDRVLFVDTWHHIPGREAYAAKIAQTLRPGGRLFIVDFKLEATHGPPRHHRLPADQVVRELTSAGFKAHVSATDLPEQYIVDAERP